LTAGYKRWRETGHLDALKQAIDQGKTHWASQADGLLAIYRDDPKAAQARIQAMRKTEPNPFIL
jgi:hypothetical protein